MRFYKTKNDIRKQNQAVLNAQIERISELEGTVNWLTNILIEANIIEDVPTKHQRTRTVKYSSTWGFPYKHQQAYVVNSVKPKEKKK